MRRLREEVLAVTQLHHTRVKEEVLTGVSPMGYH